MKCYADRGHSYEDGCIFLSEKICILRKCSFFISEQKYKQGLKKYPFKMKKQVKKHVKFD